MVHSAASCLPEMRLNILWAFKIFFDTFLPFCHLLLFFQVCWDSFLLFHCQVSVPVSYFFPCCHAWMLAFFFFLMHSFYLTDGNCKLKENASIEINLDANYISVLLLHASDKGWWLKEWVEELPCWIGSKTGAKIWLFSCCPWAISFPL